jgi:hemoglobin-like flavoprotein
MSLAVQASVPSGVLQKARSVATPSAKFKLTKVQKRLIRDTFQRLEPAADLVASLFYLRLFELDPSLRALFKGRQKVQRRELMGAMKIVIISLNHQEELNPVLRLLGARHRHYGVRAGDYATFGMAWIWVLEQSLEARFTSAAREAWTKLIADTARTMAA